MHDDGDGAVQDGGHIPTDRIYNEILDHDWFFAHVFVVKSARDQVGVQLQVSNFMFL